MSCKRTLTAKEQRAVEGLWETAQSVAREFGDDDELVGVASEALVEAVLSYRRVVNLKRRAWVVTCIRNALRDYKRSEKRREIFLNRCLRAADTCGLKRLL